MSRNFVDELASLISGTRFEDLPISTVAKAKIHLLDTLGAGIAGGGSDETEKASAMIESISKPVGSPIWGRNLTASVRDAAFLNGVSAHAFELDDCGGCDHSGAVVVPALFSLLPVLPTPVSGERLILSMVMGYEVGRRVLEACGGYETHNGLGWHSTGTCGVFGAATGASTLLGLDKSGLASALGTACSFAGGTWSFIHDGSQTKKLHAGRAAEGGVMAALLAKQNFLGPTSVLQPHTWGSYLSAFGGDRGSAEKLVSEFGTEWRLDRCSIKPYATCRGTHSAIDAVGMLLDHYGMDKSALATIEVRMSRFQAEMCGGEEILTRAQAQMSLPYAVAARLTYGKVFLAELEEMAFRGDEIGGWLARTKVVTDYSMPNDAEPEVTFIDHSGARFSATVEEPMGSPGAPLPTVQVIEKFRALASRRLRLEQVDAIIEVALNVQTHADVRQFPFLMAA